MIVAIMAIVLGVLFWAVCARISYKGEFAYYQRKWPELAKKHRLRDRNNCAGPAALLGPVDLLLTFIHTSGFKYGFTTVGAEEEAEQS